MPKIVGMCFEADRPANIRVHQNGEDLFIIEKGQITDITRAMETTTMELDLRELKGLADLIEFIKKRQAMMQTLLKEK